MSPTTPTIDVGRIPVSLTNPDGLKEFQSLVQRIITAFGDNDSSGARRNFLSSLASAESVVRLAELLVQ